MKFKYGASVKVTTAGFFEGQYGTVLNYFDEPKYQYCVRLGLDEPGSFHIFKEAELELAPIFIQSTCKI